MAYPSNAEQLVDLVERYEHLEQAKRDIQGDQKDVMGDVKSSGYDAKAFKKIIALRKRDPADVAEEEAVLEVYKSALGMA